MAYNHSYNPDALPAHAEPEEAARILTSRMEQRRPSSTSQNGQQRLSPASSNASFRPQYSPTYQNKPPPPIPQSQGYVQDQAQGNYPSGGRWQRNPSPHITSPPPPQNYGYGPRPVQSNLPPSISQPPQSMYPQPLSLRDPTTTSPEVLFRNANASGTGYLTEAELSSALRNSDFTSFDHSTVHMMMRMFSHSNIEDPIQVLTLAEFKGLLVFLSNWHSLFARFDVDHSLAISLPEFSSALREFGYRVSPEFTSLLFKTFDKKAEGRLGFDLFVQACISLRRMTDVFKRYDDDRDGYVTLSFEEFLTEILHQR